MMLKRLIYSLCFLVTLSAQIDRVGVQMGANFFHHIAVDNPAGTPDGTGSSYAFGLLFTIQEQRFSAWELSIVSDVKIARFRNVLDEDLNLIEEAQEHYRYLTFAAKYRYLFNYPQTGFNVALGPALGVKLSSNTIASYQNGGERDYDNLEANSLRASIIVQLGYRFNKQLFIDLAYDFGLTSSDSRSKSVFSGFQALAGWYF